MTIVQEFNFYIGSNFFTAMKLNLVSFLVCFFCSTLIYGEYKKGYYMAANGDKHSGLIEYDAMHYISFKSDENSKRVKIKRDDLYCFVIGKDSFVVEGVILQVIEVGRIILYKSNFESQITYGYQNTRELSPHTWYIRKGGILYRLEEVGFHKSMPPHIQDYPELASKVANKMMDYDTCKYIVIMYNNHFNESKK